MLDNKKLQAWLDKVTGVTTVHGDLNSTVYLQQIRDALLSVSPARVNGNLAEHIYLQQIRNAIFGVADGQFGSLSNSIYLQQIINAFNGVTGTSFGSLGENTYLDQVVNAAHALGKIPTQIAGLTGWWDASDVSRLYVDAGVTPVNADGQAVFRMEAVGFPVATRQFDQGVAGQRPLYRVNRQNGKSGLVFDGANDETFSLALSNFITVSTGYFFMVLKPLSAWVIDKIVLGDTSQYLQILSVASSVKFHVWDTAYRDTPASATPANVAVLITCWHVGGNLYIQKNNGTVSAPVACGNIGTLVGILTLNGAAFPLDMDFYELAIYNQVVTDADRDLLNRGLKQKWGIP